VQSYMLLIVLGLIGFFGYYFTSHIMRYVKARTRGNGCFSPIATFLSTILFTPMVGRDFDALHPARAARSAIAGWENIFGILGLLVSLPLSVAFQFRHERAAGSSLSLIACGFVRLARTLRWDRWAEFSFGDADYRARPDRDSVRRGRRSKNERRNITSCFCCCRPACWAFSMSLDFRGSFTFFWEVMLVPMYFLIGRMGAASGGSMLRLSFSLYAGRIGADASGDSGDLLLPAAHSISEKF